MGNVGGQTRHVAWGRGAIVHWTGDVMIELIEKRREAITEVCRRFGVARLEVFGSAIDGEFDEHRSDVDFLVEFLPGQDLGPWVSHYFEFKNAMEGLLGRSVDLVMRGAMKNPHFIREVNRTRRMVYGAEVGETP